MSDAVETAKQIRGMGCSCLGLIICAPFMLLGLFILWAVFKSVLGIGG